ncbi:MAG: homoserine kinase [Bacilli bacterium]|nr:homoserine kinase [Bacilli bacterium]
MPRRVKVRVPATSANMGPGFDCLGMSLCLYNEVTAEVLDGPGLEIQITGQGAQSLPRNAHNLLYQTMESFSKSVGKQLPGLRLTLHNDIPSTRGLGSSATTIVAGLAIANELLSTGKTRDDLLQMATEMEGHSDNVAPAILGGIVIAGYDPTGNQVLFKRFTLPKSVHAIVAIPTFEVSTDQSRAALPDVIPRLDAVFNVCQVGMMMAALATGDFLTFAQFANDRLHEPYRLPLMPGADGAIAAARSAGANCVTLSGSGPTLLALCESDGDVTGRDRIDSIMSAFHSSLTTASMSVQVLQLDPDLTGFVIES